MRAEKVLHRLTLNENPYPPLPSVREVMLRAVFQANRYPEFYPDRPAERIAQWCGVAPVTIVVPRVKSKLSIRPRPAPPDRLPPGGRRAGHG